MHVSYKVVFAFERQIDACKHVTNLADTHGNTPVDGHGSHVTPVVSPSDATACSNRELCSKNQVKCSNPMFGVYTSHVQ